MLSWSTNDGEQPRSTRLETIEPNRLFEVTAKVREILSLVTGYGLICKGEDRVLAAQAEYITRKASVRLDVMRMITVDAIESMRRMMP